MKRTKHTAHLTCQDEVYQLTDPENAILEVDFTYTAGTYSIDSDGLEVSDPDEIEIDSIVLLGANRKYMTINIDHVQFEKLYGYLLHQCAQIEELCDHR